MRDLRHAARRLARAPMFTAFAVLSLAVGIGVTTVAYSIVDGVLVQKPSPSIDAPGGIAVIISTERNRVWMSPDDFDALRTSAATMEMMAGEGDFQTSIVGAVRTAPMTVAAVTADYFRTLGVTPARGRAIQAADDLGVAPVVVLSFQVWRSAFAAAPDIVGRTIRLGGQSFDVVGIAPRDFTGLISTPVGGADAWIPLSTARAQLADVIGSGNPGDLPINIQNTDTLRLSAFGRLKTGTTPRQAATEIARIASTLDATSAQSPATAQRIPRREWSVQRLTDPNGNRDNRLFYVAATLVMLVVVVACTNLANLVLARGTMRLRDFAVRRALGASRWRLVREQMAETLLITAAGGATSLAIIRLLAQTATRTLSLGSVLTLRIEPGIDQRSLIIAAVTLLGALIIVGLEPALQLTRTEDLRGRLANEPGALGAPNTRRHNMLLRWQVAVATAYFIVAALTIRFVVAEVHHDSGLSLDGLAAAEVQGPPGWDARRQRDFVERLTRDANFRLDGVARVAVATALPLADWPLFLPNTIALSTPDNPFLDARPYPAGRLVAATPRILDTLGIALRSGRSITTADTAEGQKVAVVSRAAALRLFGTVDVVGKQVVFKSNTRTSAPNSQTSNSQGPIPNSQAITTATIVGVAADTEDRYMSGRTALTVYIPLAQSAAVPRIVLARAGRDATAVQKLETALRRADPDVAITSLGAANDILTGPYPLLRYFSNGSVLLGAVTLTLAMVGLFGIQSHGVWRRTREIGVRMSFGATAAQMKRMVLRDGYRPVVDGMILGLLMGFVGRLIVRAYLANGPISLFDPWMFVAVPVPVVLASFFACYLPARRASRVDPNVALRHL